MWDVGCGMLGGWEDGVGDIVSDLAVL